jgi:hypothetical protein
MMATLRDLAPVLATVESLRSTGGLAPVDLALLETDDVVEKVRGLFADIRIQSLNAIVGQRAAEFAFSFEDEERTRLCRPIWIRTLLQEKDSWLFMPSPEDQDSWSAFRHFRDEVEACLLGSRLTPGQLREQIGKVSDRELFQASRLRLVGLRPTAGVLDAMDAWCALFSELLTQDPWDSNWLEAGVVEMMAGTVKSEIVSALPPVDSSAFHQSIGSISNMLQPLGGSRRCRSSPQARRPAGAAETGTPGVEA